MTFINFQPSEIGKKILSSVPKTVTVKQNNGVENWWRSIIFVFRNYRPEPSFFSVVSEAVTQRKNVPRVTGIVKE